MIGIICVVTNRRYGAVCFRFGNTLLFFKEKGMKKRFVTTLISLIACIACAVGLAACGDDADPVAGKTYEFEKVEITKGAEGDTM